MTAKAKQSMKSKTTGSCLEIAGGGGGGKKDALTGILCSTADMIIATYMWDRIHLSVIATEPIVLRRIHVQYAYMIRSTYIQKTFFRERCLLDAWEPTVSQVACFFLLSQLVCIILLTKGLDELVLTFLQLAVYQLSNLLISFFSYRRFCMPFSIIPL